MGRFIPNPGVERELARSLELRAYLHAKGEEIASTAEGIGSSVSSSYTAEVVDTDDGVQVQANTGGINAASWIEWGTARLSARAPLRRGAEASGLKFRSEHG